MQLRTLYPFVCALCAIVCCAMDMDRSPDEQELLRNPSSPADSSKRYCLFLKVSGDQLVPIPEGFRKFFGEKIEIAKTLNPDTMTLLLPQLEVGTIKFVLQLLATYQLSNAWDNVTESLQITPFDDLIKIARTTTLLNLYDLKSLVRDVIMDILKGKEMVPHAERIVTLQKLDSLEDYFVQPLKNLLFGGFKEKLRDKNPFFGVHRKMLTQIPDQQIKDDCFAGNGTTFFWVTPDNRLKGYDLLSNIQLFDVSTASTLNPDTDFLVNANVLLTTNYAGSLCCLTQEDIKMAIYDTQTKIFAVTDAESSVITCIPSNSGKALFLETIEGARLNNKGKDGRFAVSAPLELPYEDAENYPQVISACFSRNDTFLYVIYKNTDTQEHALCMYSVANEQFVAKVPLIATVPFSDAGGVAPTQQEDQCWVFGDDKVKKMRYNFQSKSFNTLLEIPVGSAEHNSLLVNNDDSYLIINKEELINVAARRIDCRYDDIIAFGSNPKNLLIREKNPQQSGFVTISQVAVRAPEVNVELDDLFARCSLVQISTLGNLMQIFSANPQADTQLLVDFIKGVPKSLRDFVHAYCFPGIKLPHILEGKEERSVKKQKRSHE